MVNFIWMLMLLVGFVAAAAQGRVNVVTEAVFNGATTGVTVSFGLISVMVFWLGMMRIAEDADLLKRLTKALGPIVRYLFPDVPRNHPALGFIMTNMSANLFGLGNAATPMGIRAMQELQKLNPNKDTASCAMCTLLAMNTSSITLIPTTLIAIRMNFGSTNAVEIVGTTLLATLIATGAALVADRWYRRRNQAPPHIPRNKPGLQRSSSML